MKKKIPAFCLVLALAVLGGCSLTPTETRTPATQPPVSASPEVSPTASVSPTAAPTAETVEDYYPIRENVHYIYAGEGNEYAPYDVYIDYATDTRVQQRMNNGGTVMASVIAVENGAVTRVFSREESYYRENSISKPGNTQEILLMEPIEAGTSWTLTNGSTRTITDTAAVVSTPSGAYTAVAVETTGDYGTTTAYYAKGVGLVKTVTAGDGYEIFSSLAEIEEDVPCVQTVRFYYPDVNDDEIYFIDRQMSFYTNDVTRMALAAAYKEDFAERPGAVFSENTAINSLYLNADGMVYIDLSGEFLTEMNAGSGYEAMMLQCIADTFGGYYGASRVILTIDNALYESGHIALGKGEYLTVDTEGALPLA